MDRQFVVTNSSAKMKPDLMTREASELVDQLMELQEVDTYTVRYWESQGAPVPYNMYIVEIAGVIYQIDEQYNWAGASVNEFWTM